MKKLLLLLVMSVSFVGLGMSSFVAAKDIFWLNCEEIDEAPDFMLKLKTDWIKQWYTSSVTVYAFQPTNWEVELEVIRSSWDGFAERLPVENVAWVNNNKEYLKEMIIRWKSYNVRCTWNEPGHCENSKRRDKSAKYYFNDWNNEILLYSEWNGNNFIKINWESKAIDRKEISYSIAAWDKPMRINSFLIKDWLLRLKLNSSYYKCALKWELPPKIELQETNNDVNELSTKYQKLLPIVVNSVVSSNKAKLNTVELSNFAKTLWLAKKFVEKKNYDDDMKKKFIILILDGIVDWLK